MKLQIIIALVFTLFAANIAFAQEVKVNRCPNSAEINNTYLQEAVKNAIDGVKEIEFLVDSSPCSHTKSLKRKFAKLIDKKYFAAGNSHTFLNIRNNGNFFSVEQFSFNNVSSASKVQAVLTKKRITAFKDEGLTGFQFFRVKNHLIMFVYGNKALTDENQLLFDKIKQNFKL
jgi:hypothetical protein